MSEGIRDKELSLRYKAVKWVSVHNDELKLLTFPVEGRYKRIHFKYIGLAIITNFVSMYGAWRLEEEFCLGFIIFLFH